MDETGVPEEVQRVFFMKMLDMLSLVEEDLTVNEDEAMHLLLEIADYAEEHGVPGELMFGWAMALAKTLVHDIATYCGVTQAEVVWNMRERLK